MSLVGLHRAGHDSVLVGQHSSHSPARPLSLHSHISSHSLLSLSPQRHSLRFSEVQAALSQPPRHSLVMLSSMALPGLSGGSHLTPIASVSLCSVIHSQLRFRGSRGPPPRSPGHFAWARAHPSGPFTQPFSHKISSHACPQIRALLQLLSAASPLALSPFPIPISSACPSSFNHSLFNSD